MVKLRSLINIYDSLDHIRRLFHSLRDECTLVYKLHPKHIPACLYCSNPELESELYALKDSMYRHQIYGLESFDVGDIRFYRQPGFDSVVNYISMVVTLSESVTDNDLNIRDPDEEDDDEIDDLDIFMKGSAPQEVSRRVRSVLKLIETPYPEKIREWLRDDVIILRRIPLSTLKTLHEVSVLDS